MAEMLPGRTMRAAIDVPARSCVLIMLLVLACAAHGVERAADVDGADELLGLANPVGTIQHELLSRCENTPLDERFDRYRRYDQSMAIWKQVDSLRDALEIAIAASASDDERIRIDLRDEARFTLWELDEHIAHRTNMLSDADAAELRALRDEIRLLRQARVVVERLAIDP